MATTAAAGKPLPMVLTMICLIVVGGLFLLQTQSKHAQRRCSHQVIMQRSTERDVSSPQKCNIERTRLEQE